MTLETSLDHFFELYENGTPDEVHAAIGDNKVLCEVLALHPGFERLLQTLTNLMGRDLEGVDQAALLAAVMTGYELAVYLARPSVTVSTKVLN